MNENFKGLGFSPADILLPRDIDMTKWSVVACDQYTSQPEYWQRVEAQVGSAYSALHLILPEQRLESSHVDQDIFQINRTMDRYLEEGLFHTLPHSLIYVERTLHNGQLRRGLVGMVDLEDYDYTPGASSLIRATEGTVLPRIPPRVKVRENASLELPHVMLLIDDRSRTVLEPLSSQTDGMEPLYDFDLMEQGGHITGWRLTDAQMEGVAHALAGLADPAAFEEKYKAPGKPVLLFAVGDGNHSLATAKATYEAKKATGDPSAPLARYALAEVVNLHDPSLEFEPIHRVVFGVDGTAALADFMAAYPGSYLGEGKGHRIFFAHAGGSGVITVPTPSAQLAVGTLQSWLDDYLARQGGRVDYVHGDEVARQLGAQPGNLAFLLPPMGKDELFQTVIWDGVLPRKTFSMGEAHDKRFYLEARKIK